MGRSSCEMTKQRLINIIPFINECDEIINIEWNHKVSPISWADAEKEFKQRLLDAPVIDAVEVVRCRDCAVPHNKWTGCSKLNGTVMPPDGFCPFGERRTNN